MTCVKVSNLNQYITLTTYLEVLVALVTTISKEIVPTSTDLKITKSQLPNMKA